MKAKNQTRPIQRTDSYVLVIIKEGVFVMDDKRHRAGIAAVLSFVFNGLGQLYVGKIKEGLIIMTISAASMILIIVGAVFAGHWIISRLFPIWELVVGLVFFASGIIIACVVGIQSINDAYKEALK